MTAITTPTTPPTLGVPGARALRAIVLAAHQREDTAGPSPDGVEDPSPMQGAEHGESYTSPV